MTTKTEAAARYREVASLPVYPCGDGTRPYNYGLTIRQEFAARAMAALVGAVAGNPEVMQAVALACKEKGVEDGRYLAQSAVEYADALIAALEESK